MRAPTISANVISELLFWLGKDKLLYGSDYGIWTPKWLIDKFMAFETAGGVRRRRPASDLTLETKKKILGLNAARLYGIDIEAQKKKIKAAGGYAHLAESVDAPSEQHAGPTAAERKAEVWRRLQTVTDPELDEPVTDLEFVTRARCGRRQLRPHRVSSADLLVRGELLVPDGRRHAQRRQGHCRGCADVSVVLGEHMYADKINAGLAQGLSSRKRSATRRMAILTSCGGLFC